MVKAMRQSVLAGAVWITACAGTTEQVPPAEPPDTMADVATPPAATEPTSPARKPEAVEPAPQPEPEPEPVGPAKIRPLRQSQLAIFTASPEDEPVEVRLGVTKERNGKHYLAGNEKTPQAFYPHIKGVGGGYVGVGSDQAYILIGWIRPEVAWFIDYDRDVVDIHAVYRVFFDAVETPAELLALFDEDQKQRATDLILAAHEGERGKHLAGLYRQNRGWIRRRLRGVSRRIAKAGVPSVLDDQETYDYVRSLLAAGRVRPLVANLLEDGGVKGVADAARDMGVSVRVLYLSNAEEYWKAYPQNFRDNIAALPFADDATVLRTLLIWDVNQDYRYNTQPARNFLEWLAQPYTGNVYDIVHKRGKPDPAVINFFETDEPPEGSPAARRAAGT